jgi:hypothetical protein
VSKRQSFAGPSGPVLFRPSSLAGPSGPVFYTSLAAALIGFGLFFDHVMVDAVPKEPAAILKTELARERASPDVERIAAWAIASRDHAGLPFLVVDKAKAMLFTFAGDGRLAASAPILLGASRADGPAAAGATPAGRFVAATWLSIRGEGMVWINADAALTLHGIPSGISPGRAPQRLASADLDDKRISDGSLHVAGDFYRNHLSALRGQVSIAYVLPEVLPARDVFNLDGDPRLDLAQSQRAAAKRAS